MLDYMLQGEKSNTKYTQHVMCDMCLDIGNYKAFMSWASGRKLPPTPELMHSQCIAVSEGSTV